MPQRGAVFFQVVYCIKSTWVIPDLCVWNVVLKSARNNRNNFYAKPIIQFYIFLWYHVICFFGRVNFTFGQPKCHYITCPLDKWTKRHFLPWGGLRANKLNKVTWVTQITQNVKKPHRKFTVHVLIMYLKIFTERSREIKGSTAAYIVLLIK